MKTLLNASMIIALASSSALFAMGEKEPGDVKGEGKGHKIAKGEKEPGDIRGEGKGHKILMAGEKESADDRNQPKGQPEPGDDRGRGKGRG